ncbi:GtrA family protein [Lichenifustis flavocetrariae]|uniref:GtrA family protein n=1 Tax=Lichenifustis flavocetrariae TaxID=2949735 RepID=A0AA41YWK1_9HYPH|nr:GtrA family protein [Lichenifustis flavocetrariae]MCW6508625.1 GtrA family protein [Lichenifustis flavocetrariae]
MRHARTLLQGTTVRFLITGVGAALLFWCLSFFLLRGGLPAFAGTLAAYTVTVLVSYSMQRAWTFGGQHRHQDALPRYVAAQIFCALGTGLLARAIAKAGLQPAAISVATTLAGSATSYCLSRFWVFRPPTAGSG